MRLNELDRRKADLEREHDSMPPHAPHLHPNLAELYRQKVVALHDAFKAPATRDEAIGILRGLLERVTIIPQRQGLEIELVGDLARMIALPEGSGGASVAVFERSVKLVAGTRHRRSFSTGPVLV